MPKMINSEVDSQRLSVVTTLDKYETFEVPSGFKSSENCRLYWHVNGGGSLHYLTLKTEYAI